MNLNTKQTDILKENRIFIWIALVTGAVLAIPLFAMHFTKEVTWDITDFIVMGTMLFGTASAFVFISRKIHKKYRIALGFAFFATFLWLWAELAVGIFTNWGS